MDVALDRLGDFVAVIIVFCSSEFVPASHALDGALHALEPPRATDPRRGVEGRRMRDLQRGGAAELPGGEVHGGAARRCTARYLGLLSRSNHFAGKSAGTVCR